MLVEFNSNIVQRAKIATLEKQNQELQWQIAMLARDPEAQAARPQKPQQPAALPESIAVGELLQLSSITGVIV